MSTSPTMAPSTNLILLRHGETSWNALGLLQGQEDIPLNELGIKQAEASGAYFAGVLDHCKRSKSVSMTNPPEHDSSSSSSSSYHPAVVHILQINQGIQAIYASDLDRAYTTASIINSRMGGNVPVQKDVRLRETHLGIWQGKTWKEVTQKQGNEHDKWKSNVDYRMEGGETIRERTVRVAQCLRDIVVRHPGETVMIVSHGGIMDEFGRIFLNKTYGEHTGLHKPNTCICVVKFHPSTLPSSLLPSPTDFDYFTLASLDPGKVGAYMNGTWELIEWGIVDHLRSLKDEVEKEDKELVALKEHTATDGSVIDGSSSAYPTSTAAATGVTNESVNHRNDEEEAVSV